MSPVTTQKTSFFATKVGLYATAIFAAMLWGSAYPVLKLAYSAFAISADDAATQYVFAGARCFLAGCLGFTMGSIAERRILRPRKSDWSRIIKISMSQSVMQYLFYYVGMAHTTSIKGTLINSSCSFFSILIACLILKQEKLTGKKTLGVAMGFAGVVLVNWSGAGGLTGGVTLLGEGFVLLSALAVAAASPLMHAFSKKTDPAVLSSYQYLFGGVVLLAIGLVFGGRLHPSSVFAIPLLLYMSFVAGAGNCLQALLLRHHPVSRVTGFGLLNPIWGVFLSALLLREPVDSVLRVVVALALVSGGIYVLNRAQIADHAPSEAAEEELPA